MSEKQPTTKPKGTNRPPPPPAPPPPRDVRGRPRDVKDQILKPSLQYVRRAITTLTLDPRNARNHGRRDLDDKKAILAQYGQQKPIVIDAMGIVRAGNGFVMAATELGWSEVDCVITNLSGEALIAYGIADNRSGELSDWDEEKLLSLIDDISDESLLKSIGFDSAELDELLPAIATATAAAPSEGRARLQQRTDPTVRPVLSIEEVGRFEVALESTGLMNRAHALLEICDFYVKAKRQLDPRA